MAEEAEQTLQGREGVKGLLLVGHKKVPCGFGLIGDCSSDTADGAGNHGGPTSGARITGKKWGYLNHRLLFLFLRYVTPDWAKGGEEGLCVFVGVLRDFEYLTATFCHYSKSV